MYSIKEIPTLDGSPKLYRYLSLIKDISSNGNNLISGSGFSLNPASAKISAICESIERYCANFYSGQEIIIDSYNNLNQNALDPSKITKFTETQYLELKNYEEFSYDRKMTWVKANSMRTDDDILVPFELIYLKDPPVNKPMRDVISTGLACGKNRNFAFASGLNECIERDAFICFWMLGEINYEVRLNSIHNKYIDKLLSKANRANLEIRVFDITQEFKVPTILTLVRKKHGKGYYFGCAANLDYLTAIKKSIEEGIGGFSIYYEILHKHNHDVPSSKNDIKTLDDHPLYYLAGNNDSILDELLPGDLASIEYKPYTISIDDAVQNILQNGYEIYSKDITTRDVEQLGVNVVRVSIPALCSLPINEPQLDCKRLELKAERLKRDFNLEPHPFP